MEEIIKEKQTIKYNSPKEVEKKLENIDDIIKQKEQEIFSLLVEKEFLEEVYQQMGNER